MDSTGSSFLFGANRDGKHIARQEYLSGLADGTFEKVQSVFNLVERILAPVRLRDITASRIPFFQTKLRKTRSEDTLCEKWAGAPFR